MKNFRFFIHLLLAALFFQCIPEKDFEHSIWLKQIHQITITSSQSIYPVGDGSEVLDINIQIFDKTGQALYLPEGINLQIYVNEIINQEALIDLTKEGIYEVNVKIPGTNVKSNTIRIVVVSLENSLEDITIEYINGKDQFYKYIDTLDFFHYIEGMITDVKGNTFSFETSSFPLVLHVNGQVMESVKIIDWPEGTHFVSVSIGAITSNELEITISDPHKVIQRVELDFSDSTRNEYALGGKSYFDFKYLIYNFEGEILDFPAAIHVNENIYDRFTEIPITDFGEIEVYVEAFRVKSNTLHIQSREEQEFPLVELPIIFHVIHNGDPIGSLENRSEVDLEQELIRLNMAFDNSLSSGFRKSVNAVDPKFQFFLAERDAEGRFLAERGINRIQVEEDSYGAFSQDLTVLLFNSMWDPYQYINVFVVNVSDGYSWAYYPFLKDAYLPGIDTYNSDIDLTFPYSIMMNTYAMGFVHNILPHEMGHYLSLYHTFEFNSPSHCVDADFCPDTEDHYITNLESHNWDNLLDNCEGSKFLSTNYMDYIVYSNSFTHDQSHRMRVTHDHAHFFPREVNRMGSRVGRFQKGKLDLSIKPIYCPLRIN
jgi:hypothetical protein